MKFVCFFFFYFGLILKVRTQWVAPVWSGGLGMVGLLGEDPPSSWSKESTLAQEG